MELEQAARDRLLGVDQSIQDDATLLVDDAHLDDHTLVLALIHLAVNRRKQRKVLLTENVLLVRNNLANYLRSTDLGELLIRHEDSFLLHGLLRVELSDLSRLVCHSLLHKAV